ncbi:uncharacterized protein LOC120350181 [Nilaparvata lugens]|uniref:uncharacterized protein LOC120350181 n=1 Tax=Nilaparvata lugens TaxID=108931 RepID=UPI00193DC312|nr:uncharacterized protein LOC120350181 [Nilaparvata lugens]
MKTHKLDPCHYYTLPGLSWDAMLRFTGIELELLTDYEKFMMIEKGIRGGLCQVSHRHIKANNKFMKTFDSTAESVFIAFVDCNNLYGLAMSKPLPFGDFQWINLSMNDLLESKEGDEYGYILEVDVSYPSSLHVDHCDLPFLPEQISIGIDQKKLCAHVNSRKQYIVHYIALKQAVEHGLIVEKIHRALRFKQSCWLQPYIEHNTRLRTCSKNAFEKDMYKLYINSVYGKTMENVRERFNMQIVCSDRKMEKMIRKPEFIDRTIFSENLVAIHLKKKKIMLDKPIYIGQAVLDISKTVMYNFHYNVMIPKYGNENIKLAYTDTDSLLYKIVTDDLYDDIYNMIEHFDTSDYPIDHPCYSLVNKKVLGKFKDEANSKIILEFVGLRAKMYSIRMNDHEIKKAKGVQSAALNKYITFDDYLNCLSLNNDHRLINTCIRSKEHHVYTVDINKKALCSKDDKRIVLEDGISTLPIGYKN